MNILTKDIAAAIIVCLAFLFLIILLWPRNPNPPKEEDDAPEWKGWHDE